MEFELQLSPFLSELKQLDKLANGKKKKRAPHTLLSIMALGTNSLILRCGDSQIFISSAQVIIQGNLVIKIKQLIAILETFSDGELTISGDEPQVTLEVDGRKFQLSVGEYSSNLIELEKEQKSSRKRLKRSEEKGLSDLLQSLKLAQEVSWVSDDGELQAGSVFLGFVKSDGKTMVQLATYDREVILVRPEKIGRTFNKEEESPRSRRML